MQPIERLDNELKARIPVSDALLMVVAQGHHLAHRLQQRALPTTTRAPASICWPRLRSVHMRAATGQPESPGAPRGLCPHDACQQCQ
ncbi:MAG TPA: hypothetical protein VF690_05735 [Hymenobacter sp.]